MPKTETDPLKKAEQKERKSLPPIRVPEFAFLNSRSWIRDPEFAILNSRSRIRTWPRSKGFS
jgi:hypothetical protein